MATFTLSFVPTVIVGVDPREAEPTLVTALPVVAVPSPVITDDPDPLDVTSPVATVFAVPKVTFDADKAVPNVTLLADNAEPKVGAEPLPPLMISVVDSFPVPIENPHVEAEPTEVTLGIDTSELPVTLGIDTSEFPVTLGTVVVTNLPVVPG